MAEEFAKKTNFGKLKKETKEEFNMGDYYKKVAGAVAGATKENLSKIIKEIIQEDESLHKWFKRSGPKGKEKGWVDCNAPDGKGGYKSCGRKKGEKRAKYPACRPTPAGCKKKSKGKKWGKTK